MPTADLARFIDDYESSADGEPDEDEQILLTEIPSKRLEMLPIRQQSTLQQALATLNESDAEALYVIRPFGESVDRIHGIVTREAIEKSYRFSSPRRS